MLARARSARFLAPYGRPPAAEAIAANRPGAANDTIAAQLVGEGEDPRIARTSQGFLISARLTRGHSPPVVPVRFYRSPDGKQWTVDETLSAAVAAESAYELLVDGDKLWVASLRTGWGSRSICVSRFVVEDAKWTEYAAFDVTGDGLDKEGVSRFWLIAAKGTATPIVVNRCANGDYKSYAR